MARDADLLRDAEAGRPRARVYTWDSEWVTLGRAQDPHATLVDPDKTRWVTRPTGGGAVLHGHDITVSFAVPMRRSVRRSYRLAAEPLVQAFADCGVVAALAEDVRGALNNPSGPDCFSGSSPNDLVHRATGHKICGCAMRRTATAILLQASIPVRLPECDPGAKIYCAVPVRPIPLVLSGFVTALGVAFAGWDFERPGVIAADSRPQSFGRLAVC